jgi:uncharacterized protein YjiS (DUF1127 family)
MSISASFKRAIETVRRWRRHRSAVNNLLGLDDRMLADLGLHRCEIRSAVIEAHNADAPRERRHSYATDAPRIGAENGLASRPELRVQSALHHETKRAPATTGLRDGAWQAASTRSS